MTWVYTIIDNTYNQADQKFDRSAAFVFRQQSTWYTMGMSLLFVLFIDNGFTCIDIASVASFFLGFVPGKLQLT